MTWWQFAIVAVLVPVSVEVSIRVRWREIRAMFDRALMHGGSLDTLSDALRKASEASQSTAAEARDLAEGAIKAVELLKRRVDSIEDHPLLRRPGGNGR